MNKDTFQSFHWMNEGKIRFEGESLVLYAPAKSDFFRGAPVSSESGVLPESLCNAPFFYTEVEGNFVMRAKVTHGFKDVYDSCTLMIMKDETVWAKCCFEQTDFGTRAAVSVVTNKVSDDANGCNVDTDYLWLQAVRQGNVFAFHYSLDGETFYMMRYFSIPVDKTVKAGIVAQAPIGNGGDRYFSNFSIEKRTLDNIRAGK